jgi:hypothetical protein
MAANTAAGLATANPGKPGWQDAAMPCNAWHFLLQAA